jgi:hypothetical protein
VRNVLATACHSAPFASGPASCKSFCCVARVANAKADPTCCLASCGMCRVRRALLDAEIDTQRASVAADTARQKVAELEAELSRCR